MPTRACTQSSSAQVAEDGSYALDYNNPLASDFKLTEGEQTVTVPTEFQGEALETASNYAVVLFGDSCVFPTLLTLFSVVWSRG